MQNMREQVVYGNPGLVSDLCTASGRQIYLGRRDLRIPRHPQDSLGFSRILFVAEGPLPLRVSWLASRVSSLAS